MTKTLEFICDLIETKKYKEGIIRLRQGTRWKDKKFAIVTGTQITYCIDKEDVRNFFDEEV